MLKTHACHCLIERRTEFKISGVIQKLNIKTNGSTEMMYCGFFKSKENDAQVMITNANVFPMGVNCGLHLCGLTKA